MADWVLMPAPKKTDYTEDDCCKPVSCGDDDEWKYRIYIPLPPELVSSIKVGSEIELTLKGEVKRVSMSEDDKESSGEISLRIKAAKLPEAKSKIEQFASELIDD